jgi:5'-nucleotidase
MQTLALKLRNVRRALGETNGWRVRTFLFIAHNDENIQRVFRTLREWHLDIDETHILGGQDMTSFLHAIDPAIFFNNSIEHIECAQRHIPAAHVPSNTRNKRSATDPALLEISLPIEKTEQNDFDGDNNQRRRFDRQTF